MNFLTKWSMDRFQVVNISFTPVVGSQSMPSQGQSHIAASVVFDFNNVPVNVSLNGEQQSSLLLEGLTAAKGMQREFGLNVEGF